MNLNPFILGIFPPPIFEVLLPIIFSGVLGFLLCYFHRFSVIAVLPLLLFYYIYQINDLEFFVGYWSNYMFIIYTTILLSLMAVIFGAKTSWKRHKNLSELT